VCAAGEQEGSLVYWDNFANPDPIFAAFNQAYPGIAIEHLARHPDEHVQAILTEHAAGRQFTPDILFGAELNTFQPLFPLGIIDDTIDWPSLGIPEDDVPSSGNVVRQDRVAGGLVYNTEVHTPDQLPDTWQELLDPALDGQIVVDPRGRPFDTLSLLWGHDETIDYVNRLSALHPLVIQGGTAGMLAVASQQAAVTTGGRSAETFEQQRAGVPLEIKYLDAVNTLDEYNAVLKDVRHPNAARCMIAWLTTDGAQAHFDAEFKTNDTIPPGAPEDAVFVSIDSPEQAEQVAAIGEEIGRIFTGT
jgi:iron(III) transport system substrate-binding protein